MNYNEIINSVDCGKNLIDIKDLNNIQKLLGLKFGMQLREYILSYGYLGFEEIEFYGINSKQKEKSDLITQTKYLHKYFERTQQYFAFENKSEGVYALVDENDNVSLYYTESNVIQPLNVQLYKYILDRFTRKI